MKNELKKLDVTKVKTKFNHREIGEIAGLIKSIRSEGLLNPISVIKKKNGDYFLVDGHRRLESHKKLGLKTIEAVVDHDETDLIEDRSLLLRQGVHNEARKSLSVFERYLLYKKLLDAQYTPEEIGAALDVDVRMVQGTINLGRHLPIKKLQDVTYGRNGNTSPKGKVGIGNAKKIAALSKAGKLNGKKLDAVWEKLKKGKLVENINVKNQSVPFNIVIHVPIKYNDLYDTKKALGMAINTFLNTRLFKDYI